MIINKLDSSLEIILKKNADLLVQQGKGIIAADENPSSLAKRFHSIGIDNTAEQRRIYRQILFTTPDIQRYISGIIMHEETFHQSNDSSIPFPMMLTQIGLLSGIKLDRGLESLTISTNEMITLGLDDLEKRCEYFFNQGARFAQWRCVVRINTKLNQPTEFTIRNNGLILARYASICLVPIVEAEVISEGDHQIEICQQITEKFLATTIKSLLDYDVYLEGCLLKTNMITPGRDAMKQFQSKEIALATITALTRTCPAALAGIIFLSGGQSEYDATNNLNEINQPIYQEKCPWPLTFSYGRALHASALRAWNGKRENESFAQENFFRRILENVEALKGEYIKKKKTSTIDMKTKSSYYQ